MGKLGLLVASKRERPGRLVGAMGCMAQRLGPELFRKVPGVDFAVVEFCTVMLAAPAVASWVAVTAAVTLVALT